MEEFTIRNWRKYQHYTDRNPPWIKLHFEILSSEDWVILADASRVLMIACMLVGSRSAGRIPNNPEYFKRLCHLKSVDFKPLIDIGFLVCDSSCKQMLADASPSVSVSGIKDLDLDLGLSPDEMVSEWNKIVEGTSIPAVIKLTEGRRKKCVSRIKSLPLTPEKWTGVLNGIVASDFLTGSNNRKWTADFDWIISKDDNILKVVEGAYR